MSSSFCKYLNSGFCKNLISNFHTFVSDFALDSVVEHLLNCQIGHYQISSVGSCGQLAIEIIMIWSKLLIIATFNEKTMLLIIIFNFFHAYIRCCCSCRETYLLMS